MSRVPPPPYDPQVVEAARQARWVAQRTNEPDLDRPRRPFYNLMMFPYPSAEGLHVGNMFAFTGADIYGRFKRLQGHDVFEPIGFDAFGIHSENYALSIGAHPARLIPQNIATFRRQLQRFGGMFDWRHELSTTDPRYYKWTQWIFLQLFKAGLALRKKAAVNWCPACKTVLANEQVINGYCERHPDVRVEQRFLEQWFFAITRYAERLLRNLDALDWSESTVAMQRNWIGRSEGAELAFETPGGAVITVFTTRPDTVFGATYMVLAPEHPLVDELTADEQRPVINAYRREVQTKDIVSRKVGGGRGGNGPPRAAGPVPPARLVPPAPARRGPADPHHPLRPLRPGGGAREGSPRRAPVHRGFPARRHRGEPARTPPGVVLREVPAVRRAGAPRDRRLGYVPRFRMVLPALSVHRVRRPAVGPAAHEDLATRDHVHRWQRARRTPPPLLPLRHDGPAGTRAPALRGAVPEAARPRVDHQGRREDVQVARQRGDPRRLHPEVGRRHRPHVPHVPRSLPGRGGLPGRGDHGHPPLPRQGVGAGARGGGGQGAAAPARRRAEAAPDHQEGHGRHGELELQHRDRRDDGVRK